MSSGQGEIEKDKIEVAVNPTEVEDRDSNDILATINEQKTKKYLQTSRGS